MRGGLLLSLVGIIANPASGKDIRRLVAHGSVFDNQEKVRMVRRILLGLTAMGIERICYMPDYFGIVPKAAQGVKANIPIFPANFKAKASQEDSTQAGRIMEERGAGCIITLGGDGTNRAVAKGNAHVPMLPLSTGTNNVFPCMVEATLAGLAAAMIAQRLVPLEACTIPSTKLEVLVDGQAADLALVDAAVYDDPFIGSRAIWNMEKVRQIFLNRAEPHSIGLSSIGGLLHVVKAQDPSGLSLVLGGKGRRIRAPVAPGMIETVIVQEMSLMEPDVPVKVRLVPSVLSLDGERELELKRGQEAAVRLSRNGPVVVDVAKTMAEAMKAEILIDDGVV